MINIRNMKKVNLYNLLTDKAKDIYINSSFEFYEKNGIFYEVDNSTESHGIEIGNINDVNKWLESFYENYWQSFITMVL